jgi:hypothetical protein
MSKNMSKTNAGPLNEATEKLLANVARQRRNAVSSDAAAPGGVSAPTVQSTLDLWPDSVRGVSNAALRGALFGVSQQRATAKKREIIASVDGIEVRFLGVRFNQTDLDVWEMLLHLAREQPLGNRIEFTAHSLLKSLGRGVGNTQHQQLKEEIARLRGGTVEINWTTDGKTFGGGLLSEYFYDDEKKCYVVVFSEKMFTLYEAGYSHINWEQRQALGSNNLAKWLHGFYSSHASAYPYKVETLLTLCGSANPALYDFRRSLKAALNKLKKVGAIVDWEINDQDHVIVMKVPTKSQQRHIEKKAPARVRRVVTGS